MRKVLAFIAKFIALVLAILFVVVTLLVLFFVNVERQVLNPDLYKRALVEQHIYEKFPSLVADQLTFQLAYAEKYAGTDIENMTASPELEACLREALVDEAFNAIAGFEREPDDAEIEQMRPCFAQYGQMGSGGEGEEGGGGPPPGLASLTPADYETILSILIPRAWLQAQVESVIDQAFASLDSTGPAPPITISLVELREHLAGEAVVEAFSQVVRGRPPCTDEQLAVIASGPLQDLPTCRPPEDMLAAVIPEAEKTLNEAVAQMPDQADLAQVFTGNKGEEESGNATPSQAGGLPGMIRLVRWIARLGPLASFGLLLLIALFGVRSWKGLFRWWGIPFLILGLIGLGLAVAVSPIVNWAIATYVIGKIPPNMAPGLAQAGLDVGRYVVSTLATGFGIAAALIGLLGLVLLGSSFLFKHKRTAPRPPAYTETPA